MNNTNELNPITDTQKKQVKISYQELSEKVGDMVLANRLPYINLEIKTIHGDDNQEFYQTYIISDEGASLLVASTNECVSFIDELDLYVWNINHFGTAWDSVYTEYDENSPHMSNIELYKLSENK